MVKAVMFDLDGTLLSTLGDLSASLNDALRRTGHAEKTQEEVRALVGNGVRRLCAGALGKQPDDAETTALLAAFEAHYAIHMNDTTCPYPGIESLLSSLHARGIKLAVVSNKYAQAVVDICRRHFGNVFDALIGDEAGRARKPAPDALLAAMEKMGVSADECVMVGDGAQDIQAGKNARCRTIGVTWGFRTRALLEESGADAIADTAGELEQLIVASD